MLTAVGTACGIGIVTGAADLDVLVVVVRGPLPAGHKPRRPLHLRVTICVQVHRPRSMANDSTASACGMRLRDTAKMRGSKWTSGQSLRHRRDAELDLRLVFAALRAAAEVRPRPDGVEGCLA